MKYDVGKNIFWSVDFRFSFFRSFACPHFSRCAAAGHLCCAVCWPEENAVEPHICGGARFLLTKSVFLSTQFFFLLIIWKPIFCHCRLWVHHQHWLIMFLIAIRFPFNVSVYQSVGVCGRLWLCRCVYWLTFCSPYPQMLREKKLKCSHALLYRTAKYLWEPGCNIVTRWNRI